MLHSIAAAPLPALLPGASTGLPHRQDGSNHSGWLLAALQVVLGPDALGLEDSDVACREGSR